jgi:hypothetical protein
MRARPVRSRIFLPVIRLGIVSDDWKWIFLISFLAFFLPFLFWKYVSPVSFVRVPIHLWCGVLLTAASYGFFYWIRMGRKAHWFQHNLRAMVGSAVRRPSLPADRRGRPASWIKEESSSWTPR